MIRPALRSVGVQKTKGSKSLGKNHWNITLTRRARFRQSAKIIRHVAELFNHLGIAEIAGGRIAGGAKRDRADMTLFARKRASRRQ
jgi:hypothetical protein